MRKNRPTRRSRGNLFRRLMGSPKGSLSRAPRRRDVELLEQRQVLSANVAGNDYFEDQWYLNATGQQTEFDPTSPTRTQTLAEIDNNVIGAWELGATGEGVQVGIISGGFDFSHEDFVGAFATNLLLDTLGGSGAPEDETDVTGTAVAGIIGARNNPLGVVGIAYESQLVPIRSVPVGDGELTETQAAQALRWRAGIILDLDGDGMIDGEQELDLISDENVIDVYFVSSEISGALEIDDVTGEVIPGDADAFPGEVVTLAPDVLRAIEDGANAGRSTWTDTDGDEFIDIEEISSLGSIYVVPAGNDNGTPLNFPFEGTGVAASSQYNQLANSRYTIAVGAVDYDGRYENNATGTVTSFSEIGANVLLVAPSGTRSIDLASDTELNSGIITTDLSGDDGLNSAPDEFFGELDDFFADVNYTTEFGGTEAAAAQVTAVVAQMLDVNPNLSRRDVEQILLMSARMNDQFDESWVINPYGYWQSADAIQDGFFDPQTQLITSTGTTYTPPSYVYYDLDLRDDDGTFDGEPDIEDAVIPNGPFVNLDGGIVNTNTYDLDVYQSYFQTGVFPTDVTINTFSYGLVDPVDAAGPYVQALGNTLPLGLDGVQQINEISTPNVPTLLGPGGIPDNGDGPERLPGVRDLISPKNLNEVPLEFTNGVGYTISHGRGRYGEEYGYAHGLLDAELAVQLAAAWAADESVDWGQSLTKSEEISITSPINLGLSNTIQARGDVPTGRGGEVFIIPGGFNDLAIDTGFYAEFTNPLTETFIEQNDVAVASVITGGPFYDPEGELSFTLTDGFSEVAIPIDQSVDFDFLSLEWVEVRTGVASGDIDHLRVSLLSPDGTPTELNGYSAPFNLNNGLPYVGQTPQFGQQSLVPNQGAGRGADLGTGGPIFGGGFAKRGEVIGPGVGAGQFSQLGSSGFVGNGGDNGSDNASLVDINAGSDLKVFEGRDSPDAVPAGEAWTWTTNRHYGELLSVEAASFTDSNQDNPVGEGWSLIFENYGTGTINLADLQVTFHGTEATGQRIQGKIGVDDNAQGIRAYNQPTDQTIPIGDPTPEQLGDGIFNFNRYIEFGEVVVDPTPTFGERTSPALPPYLVMTGDEQVVTVVLDDPTDAVDLSNLPGQVYRTIDPDTGIERAFPVVNKFDYLGAGSTTPALTDAGFVEFSNLNLATQLADFDEGQFGGSYVTPSLRRTDGALGHLQVAPRAVIDASTPIAQVANVRTDGTPGVVRNFDYSQESFAAGQTVIAKQFVVQYSEAGVPGAAEETGQYQRFVTGADGNYYFDVESTPAPPDPGANPEGFAEWFNSTGGRTFEYDISIVDEQDRAFDQAYAPDAQEDPLSQVQYRSGEDDPTYRVQIFDATDVRNGATTVVEEVNFLLSQSNRIAVSGSVVRDLNGDAVRDSTDDGYGAVRVYYDANNNNVFDPGEVETQTEADGTYQLSVSPGANESVSVRVDLSTVPEEVEVIAPMMGDPELLIENFDLGDSISNGNFFLRPETNVVTGTVWRDIDSDGVFDPTENGVNGDALGDDGINPALFVYHDANSNGQFDPGESAATISATGAYAIEFAEPGTYELRLDTSNLDIAETTFPVGDEAREVTVAANQTVADIDFGVRDAVAFASGSVWNDADGDGMRDPEEIEFDGTTTGSDDSKAALFVYHDANANGVFDPGETMAAVSDAGNFSIPLPGPGDYQIRLDLSNGNLAQTSPISDQPQVVTVGADGQSDPARIEFGVQNLDGSGQSIDFGVTGAVWVDSDGDGSFDPDESGFDGSTMSGDGSSPALFVYHDANTNGEFDLGETTAEVSAVGAYTLSFDGPGDYEVRIELNDSSLEQTFPAGDEAHTVTIMEEGLVAGENFGVRIAATADFGDLPDSYGTLLGSDGRGARHLINNPTYFLGAAPPDAEFDGAPSDNADGDDTAGRDDEDGVRMTSDEIVAGGTVEFEIVANGGGPVLNAWIDWDNSGVFEDDEQIFDDLGNLGTGTATTISTTAPAEIAGVARYAARFRWGPNGLGPTGPANTGEVEDYWLTPTNAPLAGDFNRDGVVDSSDRAKWAQDFGMSVNPGSGADANRDGRVDTADFTVWRDALAIAEAQAEQAMAPAPATAPEPVLESTLAPATFDVDPFAPMMALSAPVTVAVDESLAVESDPIQSDADAVGAALLLLSNEPLPTEEGSPEVPVASDEEAEAGAEEDLVLAEAFAV